MRSDFPGGDWTTERIRQVAGLIAREARELLPEDRLGYIKGRLAGLPQAVCDCLEPLILLTEETVRHQATGGWASLQKWEKILLFSSGTIFLVALTIIALFVPNPTPFQKHVFCVVLSIAAASAGAILPGLIHVEGKIKNILIRAVGAVALVVVVLVVCDR